ncbi:MAG: lipid-binding SYLF domain-containing protein [Steroidobacteraceae bacterium]|jgi:lipid-binding SYLF domain-containing protein|nr:lipid-binding SYLF domain-containing protein [Steroidobacteraceae bacterium]
MIRSYFLLAILSTATLVAPFNSALAQTREQSREDARLITATQVLEELLATPDQRVPDWLMQRAYGVAIIPEVIKGAFIFGGRYGSGVMSVRDPAGRFSNPIFISLAGGSVGWQVGATSTDVVLVFVTPRSVENFARGKFTLGADASVAAGPVGRQTEAAAGIAAEIYSYSRSRGLFAGVALDGTVIAFDRSANREFYDNDDVTTAMITGNKVTTHSESARRFLAAVAASANGDSAPAPAAAGAPAPPPNAVAPSGPAASGDVHTFPMEDSHPGGEPH